MKRALVGVLLVAVPVFAGFECTVEVMAVGDSCTFGSWGDATCSDATSLIYCAEDGIAYEDVGCVAHCGAAGGTCVSDVWDYGWCECNSTWDVGATCDYWSEYPSMNTCNNPDSVLMCGTDNTVYEWDCSTACPSGAVGYCAWDDSQGAAWCLCPDWIWAAGYSCDYWNDYDQSTCTADVLAYCGEDNVIGDISCTDQCTATVGAGATATCEVQPDTGYNGCVCAIDTCTYDPYCYDSFWYVQCFEGADVWTNCDDYCVDNVPGTTKGVCQVNACICA